MLRASEIQHKEIQQKQKQTHLIHPQKQIPHINTPQKLLHQSSSHEMHFRLFSSKPSKETQSEVHGRFGCDLLMLICNALASWPYFLMLSVGQRAVGVKKGCV